MKVAVVGAGFVGLVSASGFAEAGHQVLCMDVNEAQLQQLRLGHLSIYEPGLSAMLCRNQEEQRLRFTANLDEAVIHAEVLLIAVGTPAGEDGSADLSQVMAVVEGIGSALPERPETSGNLLIVIKSTVPVGTADRVRHNLHQIQKAHGQCRDVSVASNPEFLAEGVAVDNFMRPDRIVIGVEDEASEMKLRELYAPFNRNHEKLMCLDSRSAELTKYAANAMLASRVSLMNELANVAEAVGADIEQVRKGIGSDTRIGFQYIYPGAGYGGSCFPKDIRALAHTSREYGYRGELLEAIDNVNNRQRGKLWELLQHHAGAELGRMTICLWGLAFKPNTNDIREAPALVLLDKLLAAGVPVRVHDPKAMDAVREHYGSHPTLSYHSDPYEAAAGSDALLLITEWHQYSAPDFDRLAAEMTAPVVFDGRNVWNPELVRKHGFTYHSIGRP